MVRLIIKIVSKQINDEVCFSNSLSLKENFSLYYVLKEIVFSNYYVVSKRENCLLDVDLKPQELNLIEGDTLYIYA